MTVDFWRCRMNYLLAGTAMILLMNGCSRFKSEDSFNLDEKLNSTNQVHEVELYYYGLALELAPSIWLNSDAPLQISDLLGKVVLIDFWTFG
jgi:hypothetical protein